MVASSQTSTKRSRGDGQDPRPTDAFAYAFPAIRGVQARREYFVSMCPLRLIPKIFLFNEEELQPEVRAQRTLNKARVPEIAKYLLDNPEDYAFSAITASIDGDVEFEPIGNSPEGSRVGILHVPMVARFIINDGQHRRAAIEMAMRENRDIGDEAIAVVFFLDRGLDRCQQLFADLNRHAIRPSRSIGVLYDHRDDNARLVRLMVLRSEFFRDIVELEKSTLSLRSRKLFTLSAVYQATIALLENVKFPSRDAAADAAMRYWEEVAKHLPEWGLVRDRKMSAGEVRGNFIHSHGIVLQALGKTGNALLSAKNGWKSRLRSLREIDWSRENARVWEGRAMIGGRVSKASQNVVLTTSVIKQRLGIDLSPEEQRAEGAFRSGHGK